MDIDAVIEQLTETGREQVATELGVLQSIYGYDAVHLRQPPDSSEVDLIDPLRYEVAINLSSPHEDIQVIVLVSLPQTYPKSSPPQLQLLSRYIGSFSADPRLFGSVLRTFISVNGVEWTPDNVCVFDGLQSVIECCSDWYGDHLGRKNTVAKQATVSHGKAPASDPMEEDPVVPAVPQVPTQPEALEGIKIHEAEAITDRKSVFVGRACGITHPDQVSLILNHLMAHRRIARAAHPVIHAWRCRVDNVLHQDNDDDGESAAGGRLAHLLQILEIENVLVIVTRYFGGIPLGPDRFKHINHAARTALEIGGFLDAVETRRNINRGKGRR